MAKNTPTNDPPPRGKTITWDTHKGHPVGVWPPKDQPGGGEGSITGRDK